ncbi:MAG: hypothetical protein ACTSO4_15935 [Promethearchaeota archaeon]
MEINDIRNSRLVDQNEIIMPIHWWLSENCTHNRTISGQIKPLLIFIFNYINSIYVVIEKFHLPKAKKLNLSIESNGKLGIIIHNQLSPLTSFI